MTIEFSKNILRLKESKEWKIIHKKVIVLIATYIVDNEEMRRPRITIALIASDVGGPNRGNLWIPDS